MSFISNVQLNIQPCQCYNIHMIIGVAGEKQHKVKLEDWSFLGMGVAHIILKNNCVQQEWYWKVMIICCHKIHSSPDELEDLYFQVIESVTNIQKNLLRKEIISFSQEGRKFLRDYIRNKLMIKVQLAENFVVGLADNLNRSRDGWQFSFQFKPKTPLPDKYSYQFIINAADRLKIKPSILEEMLNNRPISEKTRWFKKNVLKAKKANMNPLQIFGVSESQLPLIVKKLKKMETFNGDFKLSEEDYQVLNQKLYQQISKSSILSAILDLQLLFIAPSDFIEPDILSLWNQQTDKQKIIFAIRHNINKELKQHSQVSIAAKTQQLLNSSVIIKDTEKNNDDLVKLQRMFRFLLSWSWRDVSLIIRIKLDPGTLTILAVDFTIIDYQLKQSCKLKETIKKDYSFFDNYLKYLKMI